jgi:hypothetical protein
MKSIKIQTGEVFEVVLSRKIKISNKKVKIFNTKFKMIIDIEGFILSANRDDLMIPKYKVEII